MLAAAGHIDIVDVFRKPSDLHAHLDDILAAKPAAVWLQSGITDAAFEEALARAGIKVVSDACLKVEHQQAAMVSKM
jgi:predicted CoA-binding protein